jgi:Ca2+-transporting ATPase
LENQKTIEELYKELKSSHEGLSQAEATKRVIHYGSNSLGSSKAHFVLIKNIIGQFSDFLVIILIIAGILSMLLGDTRTAAAMFAIVILNAAIGFSQQYRTEKTLSALKDLLPQKSQVLRDGKQKETLSKLLVPGDVVILQAGDSVPVDGRIIESYSFKTNESALTGESNPQFKHEHFEENHPHVNLVFMGTTVLEGEAKILAAATGIETQFGKIAD